MLSKLSGWAVFGALFFVLAACGGNATATIAPATPTNAPRAEATATPDTAAMFEAEWQALLDAAKKEGEFIAVATGGASREFVGVFKAFEDKFGVKASIQRGSGSEVGDKLIAERAAGKFTTDTWMGGGTTSNRLANAGAFADFEALLIRPDVADKTQWRDDRFWWIDAFEKHQFIYGANKSLGTFQYNKSKVDISHFTSYFEIFDPKYKGMVAEGSDPREASGGSALVRFYTAPRGKEYLERVWTELKPQLITDTRGYYDQLAKGGFAIGLGGAGGSQSEFDELVKLGLPVAETSDLLEFPGWRAGSGGSIAVFDKAPHPNSAKLFVNWLLSNDGWETRVQALKEFSDDTVSLRKDASNDHVEEKYRLTDAFYLPQADPAYDKLLAEAQAWIAGVMARGGY